MNNIRVYFHPTYFSLVSVDWLFQLFQLSIIRGDYGNNRELPKSKFFLDYGKWDNYIKKLLLTRYMMVIFGGMRDEGGGTNQIIAWLWVYFYPTILESNILFFSTKAARCVMMRTDFFFFLVRRNICSTNYRCYQSRLFCIANLLNSFRFCYH